MLIRLLMFPGGNPCTLTAVERSRHTQDSHGQILAVALRFKCLKYLKVFPLRSDAAPPSPDTTNKARKPAWSILRLETSAVRCAPSQRALSPPAFFQGVSFSLPTRPRTPSAQH